MNQLPAGLLDHNYEFFTHEGVHAFCLTHSKVIPFEEWDEELLSKIEAQLLRMPRKLVALTDMGIFTRKQMIEQFIICNYGGFDHKADMINGKLQDTEYWACPNRGKCPQEGTLCDGLKTDTGNQLTHRELEVIKLTAKGHMDKEIATMLDISLTTVHTHAKKIRLKTGLFRKTDITRFAYQNQIAS